MPYKCLTFVMVNGEKKSPGDVITKAELKDGGQTDEDIEALVKGGSLSEDQDAELHPDHLTQEQIDNPDADRTIHVGDGGEGVS